MKHFYTSILLYLLTSSTGFSQRFNEYSPAKCKGCTIYGYEIFFDSTGRALDTILTETKTYKINGKLKESTKLDEDLKVSSHVLTYRQDGLVLYDSYLEEGVLRKRRVYQYDSKGQLKSSFVEDSTGNIEDKCKYKYNKHGQLCRVSSRSQNAISGTHRYKYDDKGREISSCFSFYNTNVCHYTVYEENRQGLLKKFYNSEVSKSHLFSEIFYDNDNQIVWLKEYFASTYENDDPIIERSSRKTTIRFRPDTNEESGKRHKKVQHYKWDHNGLLMSIDYYWDDIHTYRKIFEYALIPEN